MGIYWPSRPTPTNNPRALVLDRDGVLIDSEALHKSTKRQALRSAGIEVDETVFSRYIGRSDRVMITDVAKIHCRSNDEIEAILAEKDRLYALGSTRPKAGPWGHRFCLLGVSEISVGCCNLCNHAKSQMRPCVSGNDLTLRSCHRQQFHCAP
jgi:hypothetical protein